MRETTNAAGRSARFGRALLAQDWGMTEASPIGVISKLLSKHAGRSSAPGMRLRIATGRSLYGEFPVNTGEIR